MNSARKHSRLLDQQLDIRIEKWINILLYIYKITEDNQPAVEEAMVDLKTAGEKSFTAEKKFKAILSKFLRGRTMGHE